MALILQGATYNRAFLMVLSSNHLTGSSFGGVIVNIAKGGTQSWQLASGSAYVNAGGGGIYYLPLGVNDTNTLGDLAYWCTGTNVDDTNFIDQVVGFNPLVALSSTLVAGTYAVNLTGSINNIISNVTATIAGGTYNFNQVGSVSNVLQLAQGTITTPVTVSSGTISQVISLLGGTVNNVTNSIVSGTIAQNPLLIAGGTIGSIIGTVGSVTGAVGSVTGAVGSVTAAVSIAGGTYAVNLGGSVNSLVNNPSVSVGSVNVSQWAGGTITASGQVGYPFVIVSSGTITTPVSISAGTYAVNLTGSVNNVITSAPVGGGVNVTQWAGGTIVSPITVGIPLVNVTGGTVVNVINPVAVSGGTISGVLNPIGISSGTYAVNFGGSVNSIINSVNINSQQIYVKENAILNGFMFLMVSSTDHVTPATGLTITSQVSINGGSFNTTANSATEISNGVYTINLAAADTNGHTLMFLFSGSGADNRYIEIVTQP